MDLVYKNEKPLFCIAAVLSAIFWLALLVGTLGMVLVFLFIGYILFLFGHSAFISHLKGTGVKISEEQYPDLYEKLTRGCSKIGLEKIPEAYLLRMDFFNALATKFLGRHFVVLFTDVVDALESQSGAIDFYIGHELGHIHRKHLAWSTFIMPASVLPVLGTALRRAEEYTCDRYGVTCCQSEDDIKVAIAAIAAGDSRCASINVEAYLKQIAYTSGFWMSFNELTSDYPWLTKRMAESLALKRNGKIKHPRRHWFAWLLSCFIPRFGTGGSGSLLVTVAIIGILAAVALPAYKDYTERARLESAYASGQVVADKVESYVLIHNEWPESMKALGYDDSELITEVGEFRIRLSDDGIVDVIVGEKFASGEEVIVLEPEIDEGSVSWSCFGDNIRASVLPKPCR